MSYIHWLWSNDRVLSAVNGADPVCLSPLHCVKAPMDLVKKEKVCISFSIVMHSKPRRNYTGDNLNLERLPVLLHTLHTYTHTEKSSRQSLHLCGERLWNLMKVTEEHCSSMEMPAFDAFSSMITHALIWPQQLNKISDFRPALPPSDYHAFRPLKNTQCVFFFFIFHFQ